jgi:branched-chain amino acid transport system permease protein
MSADVDTRSALREAWANDTVKILVVLAILYGLYLGLGSMLGYSFRGQLNSLARLTFLIAIYALLALALNLHWGYTGLFNIGIAGFIAVALYTMAMVSKPVATDTGAATVSGLGLPIWVGILAGMAAAALLGLLVALPALRLRADYLAIVTIAMSEIVRFFYMSGSFQQFTLLGRDLGTGGGRGLNLNYDDPIN